MKSTYLTLTSAALLAAIFALGCEPDDDPDAAEQSSDLELVADDEEIDEQRGIEALEVVSAAPTDPSEAYADCTGAGFCFWTQIEYGGKPYIQPKGDFAVSFAQPIRSARKHQGTYRVKMFSNPNFTGQCMVFGCEGCGASSPKLLFPVRSARRMKPSEPGC